MEAQLFEEDPLSEEEQSCLAPGLEVELLDQGGCLEDQSEGLWQEDHALVDPVSGYLEMAVEAQVLC